MEYIEIKLNNKKNSPYYYRGVKFKWYKNKNGVTCKRIVELKREKVIK